VVCKKINEKKFAFVCHRFMRHDDRCIRASAHLHRKYEKSTKYYNNVIMIMIKTLAYVSIAARYTCARAGNADNRTETRPRCKEK
jgi:hypothetical protein